MSRKTVREAVVSALTASARFQQVYDGPARSVGGQSPVAIVLSLGTETQDLTRGERGGWRQHTISVGIYIGCASGQEADAEDALDEIVQATITDLHAAGYGVPGTDAGSDLKPLYDIDGALYRGERIRATIEEYD
jgi:hypothetical protein